MKRIFLLLIPVVALVTTSCTSVTPYAAVVNGHTISNSAIYDEIKAITGNAAYSQLLDQELSAGAGAGGLQPNGKNTVNSTYTAQLVYNRVLVELIDETVKKDHLTITDADRSTGETAVRADFNDDKLFDSLPKNYQTYLVDRQASLNAVIAERNTQAAQQAYYNANQASFETYCIRHILIGPTDGSAAGPADLAKANDIYKQLQGGADFATLAKANSIDTGSAAQGGDLGCQKATDIAQFVAPFAQAVLAATPGVVTQPVQSQYGYHLIEVTSKTQQSFADAQSTISQTLGSSQTFFSDALGSAKVKVNPRYGDYIPSDASSQTVGHIVPHPAATVGAAATSSSADTSGGASSDTSGSTDSSGTVNTVPAQ